MFRYALFFWPMLFFVIGIRYTGQHLVHPRYTLDDGVEKVQIMVLGIPLYEGTGPRNSSSWKQAAEWESTFRFSVVMLHVLGGFALGYRIRNWTLLHPHQRVSNWVDAMMVGALLGFLVGILLVRGVGVLEAVPDENGKAPQSIAKYQVQVAGRVVHEEPMDRERWIGKWIWWQHGIAGAMAVVGALLAALVLWIVPTSAASRRQPS